MHKWPGAHVLGLLLEPDNLSDVGETVEEASNGLSGPRVNLFNTHNRYVIGRSNRCLVSLCLMADLASGKNYSSYGSVVTSEVADNRLERSCG